MDDHILRMTEQIGELNGSVKALTETVQSYISSNEQKHRDHDSCCSENKVAIGKINARHATYWKLIGSFGGIGAVGAFLSKFSGAGH